MTFVSDAASEAGVSNALMSDELLEGSTAMYDPALLAIGTPVPSAPIASGSATPRTVTPLHFTNLYASSIAAPATKEEEDTDSPEMQQAITANPTLPPDHVRYLCMLARHRFANLEKESLSAELEMLSRKKDLLFENKENMLDVIFRAEIGSQADKIIMPLADEDVPILRWNFANRTSLPNFVRDIKDDVKAKTQGGGDEDDE